MSMSASSNAGSEGPPSLINFAGDVSLRNSCKFYSDSTRLNPHVDNTMQPMNTCSYSCGHAPYRVLTLRDGLP